MQEAEGVNGIISLESNIYLVTFIYLQTSKYFIVDLIIIGVSTNN